MPSKHLYYTRCVLDIILLSHFNIITQIFHCITLHKRALDITSLQFKPLENTAGKGEIAHNEQFLLFQRCFLSFRRTFQPFSPNLKLSSANSAVRKSLNFVVWEKLMRLLPDAILKIQTKLLSTVLAGAVERLRGHPRSK